MTSAIKGAVPFLGSRDSPSSLLIPDGGAARGEPGPFGGDGDALGWYQRVRTRVGDAILVRQLVAEEFHPELESGAGQHVFAMAAAVPRPLLDDRGPIE